MSSEALTGQQIAEAGLDGWALVTHYGRFRLQARIHAQTYAAGLELLNAIARTAEEHGREPDLELRGSRLDVGIGGDPELSGPTTTDVRLAKRIARMAAEAQAGIECHSVSGLELGLDSPDAQQIGPFWAAVLGVAFTTGDGWADVGDPHRAQPLIWFQRSGSEEPRQRWHPDIWVDPAEVQPRIDAALAAGGRLVTDEHAPSFWVLSDPQGNRACLCTWQGRI